MNKKKIKIISFIPAKSNSQDLKNKNLKKLKNYNLPNYIDMSLHWNNGLCKNYV